MHQISAGFTAARRRNHSYQKGNGGYLGCGCNVGRHLVGRSLVNIRRPEMKREDGKFEKKPAEG